MQHIAIYLTEKVHRGEFLHKNLYNLRHFESLLVMQTRHSTLFKNKII